MKLYTPTKFIKVTKNNQILLPKEMRQKLDIKEGDLLRYRVVGDMILIIKIKDGKEING